MKSFTFLITFLAICSSAWGQRFKYDDLFYEVTDAENKTVKVTYEVKNNDNYSQLRSKLLEEFASDRFNKYRVTSIGDYAFSNCSGLTWIGFPDSLESIGDYAFSNCYNLTKIFFPDTLESIGHYAFSNCHNLTEIRLPKGLTSIGYFSFYRCSGLTSIEIREGLKWIGESAFYGCSKLTSIRLPEGLTSIGENAFYGCSKLTSIRLPEGLTSIGDLAFYNCSGLTSIGLPESLKNIGFLAFFGCSQLSEVVVEAVEPPTISSSDFGLKPTTKIYVPAKSLEAYRAAAGWKDFNLLPMQEKGQRFKSNNLYYQVTDAVDKTIEVTYHDKNTNNYFYLSDSLTIPSVASDEYNVNYRVTSIGDYAFSRCSGLTSITLPNGLTSIGDSAFNYCINLTSITLPNGLKSIGNYAFSRCFSLTSITFPEGLTSINDYAFNYCHSLTSITLPNGLTSIGESAFKYCFGLTSITLPNSLKSIGDYAFNDCSQLNKVVVKAVNPPAISKYASGLDTSTKVYVPAKSLEAYRTAEGWKDLNLLPILEEGQVFKSGELYYEVTDATNKTVEVIYEACNTSLSGALIIPDTVSYEKEKCVVTSIGNSAFSNCFDLTSITLPNGLTSIGDSAFSACSGLTSITIPSNVASIGDQAFNSCSKLNNIVVEALNPPTLSKYGSGLDASTKVYVPDTSLDTYRVAEGWKDFNILVEGGEFKSGKLQYKITSVTNRTVEVTSSSDTDSIIIPETISHNNVTYAVTSIGDYAFHYCSSLTSITLPEGLTSIGVSAFSYCFSLTSITLPEGLTKIGASAFSTCSDLTSITIPSSVTSISDYVFYCSGLTSITIPSNVTNIGTSAFSSCFSLTSITLSEGLTNIGASAFSACSELTSITLPSSVTSIGDQAFSGCSKLNNVVVKAVNPPVIGVEGLGLEATTKIYVPAKSLDTYHATEGWKDLNIWVEGGEFTSGNLQYRITNVTNKTVEITSGNFLGALVVPETVLYDDVIYAVTSIGDQTFSGCSGLTSIMIPSSVTKIGDQAFYGCSGLTSITIPSSVTSIGNQTFSGCSSLTSITIPSSVTSIGDQAFSGCSGLTSITIPSSVTTIGDYAFYNSGLTSITIPSSVTSIGDQAFSGCSGLTSITIPSSVTTIGYWAFTGCTELRIVVVNAVNPPVIDKSGDLEGLNLSEFAKVYVPANSLEVYRAAEGWKDLNLQPITIEEPVIGEQLVQSIGENISSLEGISGKPFALYNVGRKSYVYLGEYRGRQGKYVMSDNPQNRNTFVFTIEKTADSKYTFRNANGQYMPTLKTDSNILPSDTPGCFEIVATSDGKWLIKDPSTDLYFNGDANGTTFNGWNDGNDNNSKYEIRVVDAITLPMQVSAIDESFDENTHWYRIKVGGQYMRYSKNNTSCIPVSGETANDFDNYLWSFGKDVNGRYIVYNKAAGVDKVMTSLEATGNDIAVHLSDKKTLGTDKNPSWDMYFSDAYTDRVGFRLGRKDDYTKYISEQDGFLKFSEEKDIRSTFEIEAVENPSRYLSTNTFYAFHSKETDKYISSEPNGSMKHMMTDKGSAIEKTAFYISDDFNLIGCTGKYMKGGYTSETDPDTYRFILQPDGETFYIKPSSSNNLYANDNTVDYWNTTHIRCNWLIEKVNMKELENSIRNSRPVKNAVGSLKSEAYDAFSQALDSPDANQTVEALRIASDPENLVEFNTSNYYRLMTSPTEWGIERYLTSAGDRLHGYDYNAEDASQIWKIHAEENGKYTLESQGVYSLAPVATNVDVTATPNKEEAFHFTMTQRSGEISYGFMNGSMFLHLKKATINDDKTINGYDIEENASFWYLVEANSINLTISSAGYATFNYPFAVRLPEDNSLEAYIGTKATETSLILKPVGPIIPANTAVIISSPSALEEGKDKTYSLDILPENYSDTSEDVLPDENLLSGTLLPETMTQDRHIYGLGEQTEIGFYRMNDTSRTVGANKAYLDLTSTPSLLHVKGMTFSFDDHEGSTTDIEQILSDTSAEEYYDLQGRRVIHPTRGIYVTKSGKKVFIIK